MTEWISGSIFIRSMIPFSPGQSVEGHTHNFDHTTILFNGMWRVRKERPIVDGDSQTEAWLVVADVEREGPCHLLIEANARHKFTYLGPQNTIGKAWCIYSHRTPQGEVSLVNTGWNNAYG